MALNFEHKSFARTLALVFCILIHPTSSLVTDCHRVMGTRVSATGLATGCARPCGERATARGGLCGVRPIPRPAARVAARVVYVHGAALVLAYRASIEKTVESAVPTNSLWCSSNEAAASWEALPGESILPVPNPHPYQISLKLSH